MPGDSAKTAKTATAAAGIKSSAKSGRGVTDIGQDNYCLKSNMANGSCVREKAGRTSIPNSSVHLAQTDAATGGHKLLIQHHPLTN